MIKLLQETIDSLKLRIQFNLNLIHNNEKKIKELLDEPVTDERSDKLKKRFNYNNNLLKENTDSIKLQKELASYIENYRNHTEMIFETNSTENSIKEENSIRNISREDYFNLTIKSEIDFDSRHPYFTNETFLNDLLSYFIEVEDYEMCARLLNQKDTE